MNLKQHSFLPLLLLALLLGEVAVHAQSFGQKWDYVLSEEIYNAILKGKTSQVTQSLNTSVEVSTPNGSGVYGKKQAEMVVSTFLSNLSVSGYEIENEKTLGATTLTIGKLNTNKGNYRIYLLTKGQDSSQLIQQFKIEEWK